MSVVKSQVYAATAAQPIRAILYYNFSGYMDSSSPWARCSTSSFRRTSTSTSRAQLPECLEPLAHELCRTGQDRSSRADAVLVDQFQSPAFGCRISGLSLFVTFLGLASGTDTTLVFVIYGCGWARRQRQQMWTGENRVQDWARSV